MNLESKTVRSTKSYTGPKHFTELSEKRHKGDYNDFFDYDEETVLRLFPYSQRLIQEVEKLLDE